MITSNTLVGELKSRFPSFVIDPLSEDLTTVIGGDMVGFISASLENNDAGIKKIVIFLNEVVESAAFDSKIASFLSEIILGIYDLKDKSKYDFLRSQLSPTAQQYFDYSISLWLRGNPKIE